MHSFIILSLFGSAFYLPQGYANPFPDKAFNSRGNWRQSQGLSGGYKPPSQGFNGGNEGNQNDNHQIYCPNGQVPHVDGSCVEPEISSNIFVYDAPERPQQDVPIPEVPKPKLNYNIVFVRVPEGNNDQGPIVVPPPQQKTLVYVLNKDTEEQGPQVIEVPAGPKHEPEVFYINYKEGDNPQLPIGIDLQNALASVAAQQGQVVTGGIGAGIGGGAGFSNEGGRGSYNGNRIPASPPAPAPAPSSLYGSPNRKF